MTPAPSGQQEAPAEEGAGEGAAPGAAAQAPGGAGPLGAPAADAQPVSDFSAAAKETTKPSVSPLEASLNAAHIAMSEFERAVIAAPWHDHLELKVSGNGVDCGYRRGEATGMAFVVWDLTTMGPPPSRTFQTSATVVGRIIRPATGTGGTLVLAENRFTGNTTGFVACSLFVTMGALTGNVVANADAEGSSLAVGSQGASAITGNVLKGTPLLPDKWLPFNEVI